MCDINLKPIRTESQYAAAQARLAALADAPPGTPEWRERELLADLAEYYEYEQLPTPPSQGAALLWGWIDRKGITLQELDAAWERPGDFEAALDGKQEMTPAMAEILCQKLGVPADELRRIAATPSRY